ncbi:hypothetical protein [uncultured Methylobacterium sp.]|uniref:hypothetical protein n=1 Tax=uncultured Methylobacterium sp. TaxID=157278 RepID=UPI0035C9E3D7
MPDDYTTMHKAFDTEASHAAMKTAFDRALIVPTYRSEGDRWAFYVDSDLQALFGGDDALDAEALVPRWAVLMRHKDLRGGWRSIPEGTVILAHWQGMGNLLHWGAVFELITTEAGPDGQPLWRRVRKEPSFVIDTRPGRDWQTIRIRGLPPEQQAAVYAEEQRLRRLRATLDRNARDRADADIAAVVAEMVKNNPDFVAGDQHALRQRLPEICHDRSIAAVAPMIADAHQRLAMCRSDLKSWKKELANALINVRTRLLRIERGTSPGVLVCLQDLMGPPPPVAPAVLPADAKVCIPAEDEAALAGLAL